jgi:hypothetical protein
LIINSILIYRLHAFAGNFCGEEWHTLVSVDAVAIIEVMLCEIGY